MLISLAKSVHTEFLGRNGKEGTAERRNFVRSKAGPRDKVMWGSMKLSICESMCVRRKISDGSNVGGWGHWGKEKLPRKSNFYFVLLFKAYSFVDSSSQDCLQGWEGVVLPDELLENTGRKHWWDNDRNRGWWWASVSRMVLVEQIWGTADCFWTLLWPSDLALSNVCRDCESHIQALFQQEGAVRR